MGVMTLRRSRLRPAGLLAACAVLAAVWLVDSAQAHPGHGHHSRTTVVSPSPVAPTAAPSHAIPSSVIPSSVAVTPPATSTDLGVAPTPADSPHPLRAAVMDSAPPTAAAWASETAPAPASGGTTVQDGAALVMGPGHGTPSGDDGGSCTGGCCGKGIGCCGAVLSVALQAMPAGLRTARPAAPAPASAGGFDPDHPARPPKRLA